MEGWRKRERGAMGGREGWGREDRDILLGIGRETNYLGTLCVFVCVCVCVCERERERERERESVRVLACVFV
jgi:hypothetical protein